MNKWLTWLKENINIIKDIFSAIREITIVVVLLLLLIFPTTFNAILQKAGFVEADFGFIKWKKQLEEMQRQTAEADSLLAEVEKTLQLTTSAIVDKSNSTPNGNLNELTAADTLNEQMAALRVRTAIAREKLKDNLKKQAELLKEIEQ
jgi:Mg-chelatase subunit ChlI